MTGYCENCGNTICLCAESANQPDISNCVLIDKDVLAKLERELEQFPDHRWMEKYYDKVEELNRAERDNEVLKEACEFYADNELSWFGEAGGGKRARQALSKIRSER